MEIEHEQSDPTKPRNGIGYLKITSSALLILSLLTMGSVIWNRTQAEGKLRNILSELDRTDPSWRLEDIEAAREQIPEEENSAGVIIAAAQNLPRLWPPEDFSAEHFWLQPANEMLPVEDSVRLSVELASVKTALAIAGKLAEMPRGRPRLRDSRSTVFPAFPSDQLRSQRIVTLLIFESLWRSQRGESNKALTACRAALNAARSLGDEPSQLSQFIRRAGIQHVCWAIERALGQDEPPLEDMTALQMLLQTEEPFPALFIATRGERAIGHRVFEGLERGDISLNDLRLTRMGWLERAISPLWYMDTREDHALFLSLMTRRIGEVQRPTHEQMKLDEDFVQVVRQLPQNAYITRSLLPGLSTIGEKFRGKLAFLRCTIIALAAERFRREMKIWPTSIDQLCPKYLAVALLDPFDGEPLRYRRVEDGVIIYSIGADGQDNDGALDHEQPNRPGADIGFRLWDVNKRRQPPRPKAQEEEKPR